MRPEKPPFLYHANVSTIFCLATLVTSAHSVLAASNLSNSTEPQIGFGNREQRSSEQLIYDSEELLRSNQADRAISKAQQAIKRSPNSASAHAALATAYLKLGQLPQAIVEWRAAIDLDPQLKSAWLGLASTYQISGQLPDALKTYHDFMSRFPGNDNLPKLRSLTAQLEKDINNPVSTSQPVENQITNFSSKRQSTQLAAKGLDDYLTDVTNHDVLRWAASRMPLKVYVADDSNVLGYSSHLSDMFKDAFTTWSNVSQELVKITFVNSSKTADIVCRWTGNQDHFKHCAELSQADLFGDRYGLTRGEILTLTVSPTTDQPFDNRHLQPMYLHAVGHILGLAGHSNDPGDIMFSANATTDRCQDLSTKDKNTLIHLYKEQ